MMIQKCSTVKTELPTGFTIAWKFILYRNGNVCCAAMDISAGNIKLLYLQTLSGSADLKFNPM